MSTWHPDAQGCPASTAGPGSDDRLVDVQAVHRPVLEPSAPLQHVLEQIWATGRRPAAPELFEECVQLGYVGSEGDFVDELRDLAEAGVIELTPQTRSSRSKRRGRNQPPSTEGQQRA